MLDIVIKNYSQIIPKGTKLYRGRINPFNVKKPFSVVKEIGRPRRNVATNNRANPPGINYSYLADNVKTVVAELSPYKNSYITIALFEALEDIKVVEFSQKYPSGVEDKIFSFAINLGREFSKVIDTKRDFIEYLPTQYFAEYCKSKGLGGVKYLSSVTKALGSFNYALFYDNAMKCIKREVKLVKWVTYELGDL